MKDQFVPYEIAVALKELGFDEQCLAIYSNANRKTGLYTLKEFRLKLIKQYSQENKGVKAPLFQQAEEWLRNKSLYSVIMPKMTPSSTVVWYIYKGKLKKNWDNCFDTYEEARLACLVKLIEICKEKKS